MSKSRTTLPSRHSGAARSAEPGIQLLAPSTQKTLDSRLRGNDESIFSCSLPGKWKRESVGARYRVTKKPRGMKLDPGTWVTFIPMEQVPSNGETTCGFQLRKPNEIVSGTYFESGDVLLSKITPSFENGKQGLAHNVHGGFGYGSTEIIPLQRRNNDTLNLFLFYLLLQHEVRAALTSKMEGSTGRKRVPEQAVCNLEIPFPPEPEQQKIAAVLWKLQRAIATQDRLLTATADLKQSAMQRLFTHGLKGEPLKDTEIGPMPESWAPTRLDACCDVVSSSLSYTDFAAMDDATSDNVVDTHGVKVSDMNLAGNEFAFVTTNLSRHIPLRIAERKAVPPGTVVFPKRGAAIATNKKRTTTTWTVLDPNLIGVRAKEGLNQRYIYYWFENFDLRTITEPGPTPQLNKKNLVPLVLPVPATESEQRAIASALATLDRKLAHHRAKRAALHDLFETLLHKLMTAEIRVADLDIDTSEVADHFVDANKMVESAQPDHLPDVRKMIRTQAKTRG